MKVSTNSTAGSNLIFQAFRKAHFFSELRSLWLTLPEKLRIPRQKGRICGEQNRKFEFNSLRHPETDKGSDRAGFLWPPTEWLSFKEALCSPLFR